MLTTRNPAKRLMWPRGVSRLRGRPLPSPAGLDVDAQGYVEHIVSLVVHSWDSISKALGVGVTRDRDAIALAVTLWVHDHCSTRFLREPRGSQSAWWGGERG